MRQAGAVTVPWSGGSKGCKGGWESPSEAAPGLSLRFLAQEGQAEALGRVETSLIICCARLPALAQLIVITTPTKASWLETLKQELPSDLQQGYPQCCLARGCLQP